MYLAKLYTKNIFKIWHLKNIYNNKWTHSKLGSIMFITEWKLRILKRKSIGVKFILWQELSLVRKWVNKKEFNICVRFILGKVNNSLSW